MGVCKVRWLLFVYLAFAVVRSSLAQCEGVLNADTRLLAEREPVAAGSTFSLVHIAELAKQSVRAPDNAPLDFYTAQVTDKSDVSLDHGVGGICLLRISVERNSRDGVSKSGKRS
jgi:hypothetical protein